MYLLNVQICVGEWSVGTSCWWDR